jgi:glycine oxidase
LVLEKTAIAAEASSGGAGLLSTQAHTDEDAPLFDLKLASRALYPDLAAELRERADTDIELRPLGHVVPAFGPEDATPIQRRVAWQSARGLAARWLLASEARDLEPGLPETLRGAGWFPDDHHVNPTAVTQGLAGAVTRLGGQVRVECPVSELLLDGKRVTGVRTAEGPITADVVVLAAGAWSGEFQRSAGIPIPVLPAKGQIAVARLPEPALRHVVYEQIYVIPRATGEHIIGSTVEYVGFDKGVTMVEIGRLLKAATALAPALGEAELVASYGCLRPASADGLPLLGRVPERPGLILATGHFRNGILLAPITGKIISELILQGTTSLPLEPFRPDRPFLPGPPPQD